MASVIQQKYGTNVTHLVLDSVPQTGSVLVVSGPQGISPSGVASTWTNTSSPNQSIGTGTFSGTSIQLAPGRSPPTFAQAICTEIG